MAETTNFAKKKASVLDVLNMLSAAAYNAYDGRVDNKTGEAENVGGLTREDDEVTIHDKRLMDGFGLKFLGDKVIIKYHAEFLLSDANDRDFPKEINSKLADIVKYLRKEYTKLSGKSLTLTKVDDEPTIDVSPMSKVRAWVQAKCMYKLGGLKETIPFDEKEDILRPEIEKFLAIGKDKYPGVKKPENVKPSAKLNEMNERRKGSRNTGTTEKKRNRIARIDVNAVALRFLNSKRGAFSNAREAYAEFKKNPPLGFTKKDAKAYKNKLLSIFKANLNRGSMLNEMNYAGRDNLRVENMVDEFVRQAIRHGDLEELRDLNNAFDMMRAQAGLRGWGEDIPDSFLVNNEKRIKKALSTRHYLQESSTDEIDAAYFKKATGHDAQQDDLERSNCKDAGKHGHSQCGWCKGCNRPKFMGCKCGREK